jgi:hypothetical protein
MAKKSNPSERTVAPRPIESPIHVIRGQKVMVDADLADLYGVPTGALNQAVRRNTERFPEDFAFRLSKAEFEHWKSQIVIANPSAKMGLRHAPFVFTQEGVAMLSAVLRCDRAEENWRSQFVRSKSVTAGRCVGGSTAGVRTIH